MLGVSAVTGLPAIAAVSMGMSAAADQAKGIIERGGTNRQAFWGGLAAGIAEAVCEKIPLDNLLNVKSADDVKGLLTNVFKQQVIEGGEEMLTEVANMISDAVIMKDNSKFNNRVEIYMAEGMSENEAKQKATMDAISDVALAGAGGFVAGGLLGGAVNVGKYASSGAMQGAGSGINVPVMGKYTANNQGAAGAVTSGNSNTQVQQSGNGQTQTVGNTSVFDGKTGRRTHTQVAGNSNAPTAARSSGAMQTGTSANAQTPTGAQHQMQAQTDTQNGKTIKSEGKVSELLQEAMAQPADSPARQLAETLIAQQETALVEQGLELGSQYQISHAEQARLAAETANNAIPEQTVGELARLMEQEYLTETAKHDKLGISENVKLENAEVRKLYVEEVSKIHGLIDPSLPLEERARLAFEAREELDKTRPNKTFDELVLSKMTRKGLTREEALEDVYRTAVTTNKDVNHMYGVGGE